MVIHKLISLAMLSGKISVLHRFKLGVFFVFLLFCSGVRILAQAGPDTATVTGAVRDASNLAVPQATVVLINTARGVRRETTTNDTGSFVFPNVPIGRYELESHKDGFQTKRVTGIQLQVGQVATVDMTMQVGALSTVVSVSGEQATALDTESNVIGTVVNSQQVQQLPLNGRDFLQLALTASGSSAVTGGSNVYSSQIGHPDRAVVINGNPPTTTGYTIDGIATRGQRLGESALNLSIAAIDQFKVQQGFFLPDQGPDPGLINVTTHGGTNGFHGQAFEFLRNDAMDARSFFSAEPETLKRNQFGGALGGPIKKDRIWFYGFYEGLRQVSACSANAYTPTEA
ncbi:MAG TPA: carboxypeptidase-like regulatory domain-containing protein, partial [Lacipirellulaceae bacterium]|nr:carboxypeptidase-like regulatory domain-containing protein [Lacipirellulaceae bacterium]